MTKNIKNRNEVDEFSLMLRWREIDKQWDQFIKFGPLIFGVLAFIGSILIPLIIVVFP